MQHDISNDLMGIQGYLRLYSETGEKELLERTDVVLDRSIKRIKSFTHKDRSHQITNASVVVDLRTMILAESEGYEILVSVTEDVTCLVNENLRTVFSNIIGNAVQHSGTDRIEITLEKDHNFCIVRIRDYGKGIPPEMEKRIFEKGYSFGPLAGTGMGLYLTQTILERYGATITYLQGKPAGSIFEIRLPIK